MQKKLYELEREFKSDVQNGLTDEQIAENREQYGKNALEEKKKANLFDQASPTRYVYWILH